MSLAPRRTAANTTTDHTAPHPLDRLLAARRPIVMGILNVTPDSFADGGRFDDPARAVAQAERMIADGADLIDIGGESTRPYKGATPVSTEEELARVMPVVPRVVALGVPVSIDTMKAAPDMARVVAAHKVPVVAMHNRDAVDPAIDILADIEAFFARSLDIAARAGIASVVLDPGIGFGKSPEQSLEVVAKLDRLRAFGRPLLIGLSRKRFISSVVPSQPQERLPGSIAANVLAVLAGAAIVRVHDVAETVQALRVASAIRAAR